MSERPDLASYAAKSSESRGRKYLEEHNDGRSAFEKDRDRIIHCAAFRRLEYKTQVFVNHEGDYYRTRLTHSLEVSQIAKAIARRLGLNEDLTEALALSHDLGHTPFGHIGEVVLNRLMREEGGFEHNRQSYRVVTELEERYPDFPGLNLTWETREGILKHSLVLGDPDYPDLDPGVVSCLEAQLIGFADEIAYNNHDIDDGLKSGLIDCAQMASAPLWSEVWSETCQRMPDALERIRKHRTVSGLINFLVQDLVDATAARIEEHGIVSLDDLRRVNLQLVDYSPAVSEKTRELKRFLMRNLYRHPQVEVMHSQSEEAIELLFTRYLSDPELMPEKHVGRLSTLSPARAVCDYIAGMTDRFALEEARRLA